MNILLRWVLLFLLIHAGYGYGQSVDTVKAIYEILAEKDNHCTVEKVVILKAKGYYMEEDWKWGAALREYALKQSDSRGRIFSVLLVNNFFAGTDPARMDEEEVEEAVEYARMSADPYLQAGAYWLYGRLQWLLDRFETMLVYYNAAFELFRELGIPPHEYVNNINFDISHGLYRRYDYRNSVDYSLRCYRSMSDENSKLIGLNKLYLLDLMGAGYRQLGMLDSSVFFYDQLLSVLTSGEEVFEPYDRDLWTCIAEGRIGENLLDRGELSLAAPLINKYYTESIRLDDSLNILLSGNALAGLRYRLGEIGEARQLWEKTLKLPGAKEEDHISEKICRGLAQVFRDRYETDSAMFYQERADDLRRAIDRKRYLSGLNAVKQEYEFMRLTSSVRHLNTRVRYLRNTRNYAVVIILLISGCIYLFQRKRTYKLRYKSEVEKKKKELAEKELDMSRERLMILKDNLQDRNNLAGQLIRKIRNLEQSKDTSHLISDINDYILNSPEDWEKFKTAFLKIHPHFIRNLEEKGTPLSPAERRLSLLLYLKLENSEIAKLLGISISSVYKSKFRLKQKLNLENSAALKDFIESL